MEPCIRSDELTVGREARLAAGFLDDRDESGVIPKLQRVVDRGVEGAFGDEDVLPEVAEAAGVSPTFGCRAGSCGLCRTALTEGRVSYVEPIDEPGNGFVFPCCAIPETNCRLDL